MIESDTRQAAYQLGAKMARSDMLRESPLDAEALRRVTASDVVVVQGQYDHVETVLAALEIPNRTIGAGQLEQLRLRPEQLVVVNCPGQLTPRGIAKVRDFVRSGGSLFTTDWALRHVIEPAFPGFIEYNDRPTGDDVVRIEVLDSENRFLTGVIAQGEDPQWWLEGSSYPIRVLDQGAVQVLIRSTELESKYGEAAVAVLFSYGQGEVFHMISHYYLQRTETRNDRHASAATSYAQEKGYMPDSEDKILMEKLNLGEVESAQTSARLFANIIADKKRRSESKESGGD